MSGNAHFRIQQTCRSQFLKFGFTAVFFFSSVFPVFAVSSVKKDVPASVEAVSKKDLDKTPADVEGTLKPAQTVTVIGHRLSSDRRDLREIPSNLSYLDQKELEGNQAVTLQGAVKSLEGATFFDNVGNGRDTSFGLRGFAGSSNISFLLDGVRVNEPDQHVMNFPLVSMDDIESIQVDRGSASPVYGSQAFAGAVNITTGQPSEKFFKLFGGFEWGSFHSLRFYKGFSGTVEDRLTSLGGKFKYYFRGGRNVGKSWRPNDDWRMTSFDVKTAYELPDEQGRAYVNVKHMANAISNPGEMTFQQYQDDYRRTNKPLDGRDYRSTIVQIGADKKFWDDHFTASIMNSWRTNLNHFYTTLGTFTTSTFNPETRLTTTNAWDQNLIGQLKYENYLIDEVFSESLIGMEFRDQNQHSTDQFAPDGNVAENRANITNRGAHAYNTALFWRETLKIFDKIIPYFGMRHDYHWLRTDDFLNSRNSISNRWRKSTLSTGVTVTPVSFTDLFFNYSQGFRVPSISEVTPFSGTISSGLKPEKSHSFDVGTRLRYKDLAAYKTSYFLIDTVDEIAFDSTQIGPLAPFGQNINIARSRRYGVEQRLDLTPLKELKMYGSYTWMRAYVRETGTNGTPFDGRELGQIPENRFTFGSSVTPLARLGEPFDGFKMSLQGVFTGRQHPEGYQNASQATLNTTGGAGHMIKHYTVFDFMMSYTWREKIVYFKINNLFDEKYYTRAVNSTSFGTALYPAGTFTFVNPGAPREFVIGSKWAF